MKLFKVLLPVKSYWNIAKKFVDILNIVQSIHGLPDILKDISLNGNKHLANMYS